MPPSAKTGRNDSTMIATENTIGRPTARQAGSTTSRTSPRTGSVAEVLLEPVHHVLGHHDRRVDQHADRDRDPGQRHGVGRDVNEAQPPQHGHDQERRERGQWQRAGDDERRPHVQQDHKDAQRRRHHRLDDRRR